MPTPSAPRWITDTEPGHSQWYVDRFRTMAADGVDLVGEARLVDAMVGRNSRILDAGCGPGRVGGHLHEVGHDVIGVDVDPILIDAAIADHPGPDWRVGDLAVLDLDTTFDAIVCAGNLLAFVAPNTESLVLGRLKAHLAEGGFIIVGFHIDKLALDVFDAAVADAGLRLDLRLSTWDVKPWHDDADFAVSILRAV
ncbi:hypothetical protein nbrc107696_22890 [Gordonia spumicola]|uniref:Methyltransferase domain-containing protein n=1 Tax=Gordonia spumicola TaxID=589161 RepID=A0A7I9V9T5_9ACTN|nr:class I SAM-dependent methyltransferase [Gordonia spumicola]GEE01843.1 hypothetical protein nbrc107696_22890 [Gordonia spumicola]